MLALDKYTVTGGGNFTSFTIKLKSDRLNLFSEFLNLEISKDEFDEVVQKLSSSELTKLPFEVLFTQANPFWASVNTMMRLLIL